MDWATIMSALEFQPALPMRGVTPYGRCRQCRSYVFQPALPMRGVTRWK